MGDFLSFRLSELGGGGDTRPGGVVDVACGVGVGAGCEDLVGGCLAVCGFGRSGAELNESERIVSGQSSSGSTQSVFVNLNPERVSHSGSYFATFTTLYICDCILSARTLHYRNCSIFSSTRGCPSENILDFEHSSLLRSRLTH